MNRWTRAIAWAWANAESVYWRIYAALGGDEQWDRERLGFNSLNSFYWKISSTGLSEA